MAAKLTGLDAERDPLHLRHASRRDVSM